MWKKKERILVPAAGIPHAICALGIADVARLHLAAEAAIPLSLLRCRAATNAFISTGRVAEMSDAQQPGHAICDTLCAIQLAVIVHVAAGIGGRSTSGVAGPPKDAKWTGEGLCSEHGGDDSDNQNLLHH